MAESNKSFLRTALIIALLLAIAGWAGYTYLEKSQIKQEDALNNEVVGKIPENDDALENGKTRVYLYFADKDGSFLKAEERLIPFSTDPTKMGREIIQALIKGPGERLARTLPVESGLNALFLDDQGTAYVDLTEDVKEKYPGGAWSETLTIFSIVNSLVLNIPVIRSVKILIGGHEASTLAGHMDLSRPFSANMLLVR